MILSIFSSNTTILFSNVDKLTSVGGTTWTEHALFPTVPGMSGGGVAKIVFTNFLLTIQERHCAKGLYL